MGFNKIQIKQYTKLYNSYEKSYNDKLFHFLKKGKIPYILTFETKSKQALQDMYLYYNILNEIQSQPNKKTYLITFTSGYNLDPKRKIFFNKLRDLKKLKKFRNFEFDYFTIIEPKQNQAQHLHIKLVITPINGIYTAIKKILSYIDNRYTNIKLEKSLDKSNYLIKEPKENSKAYIGWLLNNYISIRKSFSHSRYIKIDDNIKITLNEYKKILSILLKNNSNNTYIGLNAIKDYIINKKMIKPLLLGAYLYVINYKYIVNNILKSSYTLYIYLYQVAIFKKMNILIILKIDLKNNSPNLKIIYIVNKFFLLF